MLWYSGVEELRVFVVLWCFGVVGVVVLWCGGVMVLWCDWWCVRWCCCAIVLYCGGGFSPDAVLPWRYCIMVCCPGV